MADKDISVRKENVPTSREEMRAAESYIRPAVDIFETDENLTLVADMPGVEKEHLSIDLDKGILTLKGTVKQAEKGDALSREFSLANYYRQFQLPNVLDTEKTSADLKNGVLTLTISKSENAKPRRIEIRH